MNFLNLDNCTWSLQMYHLSAALPAVLPLSYLQQVSHVKCHCKSKGLCNAPGMQLTNKERRMMTQSAEEVTDENHSAGMVGGHRKVLSGFLKLDSRRLNKRPHIKYLFLIHIISKTKDRLAVNINSERKSYTCMQTHTTAKQVVESVLWYTWGTHCCRVRVHITSIFSPAATSIMCSLRKERKRGHFRCKGVFLF